MTHEGLKPPTPKHWQLVHEKEFNLEWTEECQGIAGDEFHWYVTSNAKHRQRIYKLDGKSYAAKAYLDVTCGHLGALTHHDGYLYLAVEQNPQVFRIELASFMTVDVFTFQDAPERGECSWVAIDPISGYLYSSAFGGESGPPVTRICAYRLDVGRRRLIRVAEADVVLPTSANVRCVQGGAVTPSGYLVLACDTKPATLRSFSMAQATEALPACGVAKNALAGEELEGIGYLNTRCGGQPAQLHVVLLDNNVVTRDHAIIKHYAVPDFATPNFAAHH